MLTVEEAQARILALGGRLSVERTDLKSALGRFLSEPLLARRTQPAAAVSAMDGFAVVGPDLTGPWTVIGESAAGHPFSGSVEAGQAVRISTGALIPAGADCVLLQEDITRTDDVLELTGTPPKPGGPHIRPQGNDFVAGTELLPAGTAIGPAQIALALAAGHTHLAVRRKPRIVVIDSGDELACDPENCAAHQVPASNGAMLEAMLAAVPCTVERIGPIADCMDDLVAALAQASSADIVVSTGGASVGDHDLVRPALESCGAQIDFWKVAMKPGKPLLVARLGDAIVLGLPGNPVSSFVTANLFLLPLLRHITGSDAPCPRRVPLPLSAPLPAGGSRREYLRGRFENGGVAPLTMQDSSALGALARAEALIDVPAHADPHSVGDTVWAYLLQTGGIA